ncbi:hypothetical protein PoB_004838300 [Plakobranchus ocellatus]|uniref:Uncharacterized protein n=1 Tax=Plakobranchus ocellatus TaxID=259542 RepID=A0AAV4BQL6_9GAST|nr:hypothetical protein PoB_004838300 [Plakobranchus ocellatus]
MGQTDDIGKNRKKASPEACDEYLERESYVPLDYVRRNKVLHRPANQKASLIMVPAVGGTVNRKSASERKGVFCQEFELHHHCSGLIEGLQTSDHLDDENANRARISLSAP